jgi:hypothetical protein
MTFACRTFQGMSLTTVLSASGAIADTQATAAAVSGTIVLQGGGAITGSGNGTVLPARWTSLTGTPGTSYWIKFTNSSGVALTTGQAVGTIYSLSAGQTLGWAFAAATGTHDIHGVLTINFYTDAGATTLDGTITVQCDITNA